MKNRNDDDNNRAPDFEYSYNTDRRAFRWNGVIDDKLPLVLDQFICECFGAPIVDLKTHINNSVRYIQRKDLLGKGVFVPENYEAYKITFSICSVGGDVLAATATYDLLRLISDAGIRVEVVAMAHAYSAAAIIFCGGDDRTLTKNTRIMLHRPFIMGNASNLKHEEITEIAAELERLEGMMADIISKTAKKSRAKVLKDIKNVDLWLIGQEAVDYGLATEVL